MSAIVQIYVNRIRAGKMTLEQVPLRWRAEVEEALGGEAQQAQATQPSGTPDETWTKHELVEYATEHGITAYESWTKERILAAIREAA